MEEMTFEVVRREPEPLIRAQRATELLTIYQQRSVELARIRRDAINEAVATLDLTYTEVAHALGLSKGRITQIRTSAPPAERGLFGVGPITLAVPVRAIGGRPGGVVAVEDAQAAEIMTGFLASLSFVVTSYRIPANGLWTPPRDAVAICGPKSSSVTAEAINSDPHLTFAPDSSGHWVIASTEDREVFTSPMDQGDRAGDVAYVGRLRYRDASLFVIAGVHARGSVGAVTHLTRHAAEIYSAVGEDPFSMVVASRFAGEQVVTTEAVWEPRPH